MQPWQYMAIQEATREREYYNQHPQGNSDSCPIEVVVVIIAVIAFTCWFFYRWR